ncbi:MAG TPA: ABC transporter substrate binding protein [Polyangia bacterium]|nr:ABC transporter substrate binding protein [Polyangia bacterium]
MTRALAAALALLAAGVASGEGSRAVEVVVLKRAGVTAYEEVSEEFAERCRVKARVVSFGDEGVQLRAARIDAGDLVVTVGQEAFDAAAHSGARLIPTLAFHTPAGLVGPPAAPPPELLLRVLATARPTIKIVGAVYGPRSAALAKAAQQAAERAGLTLIATQVKDGPQALRALVKLVPKIDAIWLPGDTDVITPQVFQYALREQLERGLPVAAATRQQVHSGALMAVDFAPRAAGRVAADLANRFLDGREAGDVDDVDLYGGARITINAVVARRLGVDGKALENMGAKIEGASDR